MIGLLASAVGIWVTFPNPWATLIGVGDWRVLLTVIDLCSFAIGATAYFIGQATIGKNVPPAQATTGGQAMA